MRQGVNLIGYARAESGLGEACRSAARALQAAEIPFCIINMETCPARKNDLSWIHKEAKSPLYNTNLFMINADQLYSNYKRNFIRRSWFAKRYNIGFWHWELPEFPHRWMSGLTIVDEVWVPSKFTQNSISKKSSKPVLCFPHSISIDPPAHMNRQYWGLPEDRFLFLMMYDTQSTSARKNPLAVINAFQQAFQPNDPSIGLVIKINNASHFPEQVETLKQTISGFDPIFIIDRIVSRSEVNGLIASCDSYVSLHRSEGFGLPMAEAMFLGKPVIATKWSGNMDFMNEENACLVDFTLQKIGERYGPYAADQLWAEPNIDQAALFMKRITEDRDFAGKIGENGKSTIIGQYSPQAIGERYQARLQQLGLL
ncbi:glycosyltransferase family 4 protein [Neobacillus muris]|uniref:glycosyltransferase family 4 protein n=1 Tax=Neobacillus muris TaxID=2941334 RepID=UPI00203F9B47|nr:glycosyltransferase [Neobacillus muris]